MMPEKPNLTASIVVATFQRPDHVRACLEHLAKQTVSPVETVVVDSSPDERTKDVVATFPDVVYLRNELGRGHTAASRAIGVAHTTGDVIAFVDDDGYAEPTWLEHLLARYEPGVGAVGGLTRNAQPGEASEGVDQIGRLLPNGRLTGYFAADPGRDIDVDHLIGCNMSILRSALKEVGGIRDLYPGSCLREESDPVLRIRQAGYRIVFTPTAAVDHMAGQYAKGRRFDTRYNYYGARNHVVLLTQVFGFPHPIVRRYLLDESVRIVREVGKAIKAPFDPTRPTGKAKARGVAGGFLRAATAAVGTTAGLVASLRALGQHSNPRSFQN